MRTPLSLGVLAVSLILILSCGDDPVAPVQSVSPAPAGKLYTLSQTDSLITIFDTKTMSVLDTFTAPVRAPHYICFEPSGLNYYIVSLEQGGRISKYGTLDNSFQGWAMRAEV